MFSVDSLSSLAEALRRRHPDRVVAIALDHALRPLRRYDLRHHGDLERTLVAYLQQGGSISETARRLFLHRNSVFYRLQRIEEVSGLDLQNPEVRRFLLAGLVIAGLDNTIGDWSDAD
jgi:DNA-binding PucR family transcriptional regulator